jgi:hypothetical protein
MRHGSKRQERSKAIAVGAVLVALFMVAAAHPPTRLDAQSAGASSAIPDLTAIWHRQGPLDGKPNAEVVPTNRAAGFEAAFDSTLQPTYDCSPIPMPGLVNDNYDFQIVQQADRVILTYEKMDVVRTVWLEGHGHPIPGSYDYTIQGHSIGRYEGSQLVVETTKFSFDPRGFQSRTFIPSSTMKKMTERYWRDGDILKMESVTEDPLTLRQPFHYNFQWTPRTAELTEYNCEPEDSRFGAQFHPSKYPPDE